jgi:cysteine desulfurase/selenocysteine lyase
MPINEDEVFQERILEHYEDPYHRGSCEYCTHVHEDRNPLCGDVIRMTLHIDDGGKFREVYFDGSGCCISQAASSMLVERFDGKTVEEVKNFTADDMLKLFGAKLTPNRQKCCLLPWRVLQAAIYSPVDTASQVSGESLVHVELPRGASGSRRQAVGEADATAGVVAGANSHSPLATRHSPLAALDAMRYRGDFPVLTRKVHGEVPLVYLDNAATTQRPRQVIRAVVEAYEGYYANVHRGIHTLAEESTAMYEAARQKVAGLIHAPSPRQVIFTHGSTESINLVARSWGDANVRAGDRILVTQMEHHANLVPWHQLAERSGAVIRCAPITDDGRLDQEAFLRLLEERPRLVAVAAVSNVLGTINPIDWIVQRSHEAGALVLVDGAQSVPHQPTDVAALGVDFLAFSGHKMLGPTGVGVLYGKRELLEATPPFMGGGHMIDEVFETSYRPSREIPDRFEPGTPPIVPAIGLGAAIDYLQTIGLDAVAEHESRLVKKAYDRLHAIEGLEILGPTPDCRAGILSFAFTGSQPHPHDVAAELDKRGIAVRAGHHCAMPLHQRYGVPATTRASFYLYNTEDEVEALGKAVEEARDFFRRRA